MTVLIAVALLFALRGLVRGSRKATKTQTKPTTAPTPVSAVEALQAQRESIEEALDWIDDLISTEEKPEKVLQWMTKRGQLKGQLATVEQKIEKLTR